MIRRRRRYQPQRQHARLAEPLEARRLLAVAAFDTFDANSNLASFSKNLADFGSGTGDAFQVLQRNAVPAFTIPAQLLDNTLLGDPTDVGGVIKSTKTDKWFGITDTYPAATTATANWVFNVPGWQTQKLKFSVDMAAMGDFEANVSGQQYDFMKWSYSYDGTNFNPIMLSTVDEAINQVYTMEDATTRTLDDPMRVNGTMLTNNFQTFTDSVGGIGNTLYIRLEVKNDEEATPEAIAIDNLYITGDIVTTIPADVGGPYVVAEGGSLTLNANPITFPLQKTAVNDGNPGVIENELWIDATAVGLLPFDQNISMHGYYRADVDYTASVLQSVKFLSADVAVADSDVTSSNILGGIRLIASGVRGTMFSSAPESVTPDGNKGGSITMTSTTLTLNQGTIQLVGTGVASSVNVTLDLGASPADLGVGTLGFPSVLTVDGSNIGKMQYEIPVSDIITFLSVLLTPEELAEISGLVSGNFALDVTGWADLNSKISPSANTFTWDVNGDGIYGDATGSKVTLNWAQLEALGITDGPSTRNVRVRESDGVTTITSAPVLLTINNTPPTVTITGPTTAPRGSAQSFTVTSSEPSSTDAAALLTYNFDWDGNGSTDQSFTSATGSSNIFHTFPVSGLYTIRFTAVDKDGGVSAVGTHTIRIDRGNLTASGGETAGNTTTANDQTAPAVSNDLFGNFVMAWVDSAADGAGQGTGVYAKVFNNTGGVSIPQFRVNTTLVSNQDQPAVAMDQFGNFMVVYRSGQGGTNDIWGKLYNRFGAVVRDEFVVNSGYTTDNQALPSIAVDAAGNFVVVWQSNLQEGAGTGLGVYGQLIDKNGQFVGSIFHANVTTAGNQDRPKVDMANNGSFVVTWRSLAQDTSGQGSYMRRFDAAGVALDAADVLVNTTVAGDQTDPMVAVDADGDFVIAWTSAAQDGSGNGVYAQRFNAAGVKLGGEILVNQTTADNQQVSQIVIDGFGDFMVGWESNLQDTSLLGLYWRRFALEGTPLTAEAKINTTVVGDQKALALTANYDGDMVAAWQSADASGQGVFFQRYNFVGIGNTAPVANAGGPYTLVEGHTLSVTAAASSDVNNDFLSYRWDINGDGAYGDLVGVNPVVTWPQLRALGLMNLNNFPQVFNVTVRVNDGTSVTTSAATTLTLQAFPSLSGETQVNTTTAGLQDAPVVASDAAGNYVVVWESPDATAKGVLARRYFANGTPNGAAFVVNTTYTSGDQFRPAVSMDAAGNFVILWQSFGQDGNGFGIRGRRYDTTGALVGSEFGLNSTTFDQQVRPTVKLRADGSIAAVWQSYAQDGDQHGIFGRLFDSSNAPLTAEFAVNTFTTGFQEFPKIAADSTGNFVVVWTSGGNQDTNGQGIYGRRYNANGTPNGGEFQVNTKILGNQFKPSVAMDDAGNFVVAWSDSLSDGNANGIFARRYNSSGTAVDAVEFQVNTYNVGLQQGSAITMDGTGGNFIITYESFGQDSSDFGIYARQYDFTNGATFSGEFRVNTTTANAQTASSVAIDPSGQYVVVWNSNLQDGDQGGIYSRRFQLEVPNFAGFAARSSGPSAQGVDALAARLALDSATDADSDGSAARRRRGRVNARANDAAIERLFGG